MEPPVKLGAIELVASYLMLGSIELAASYLMLIMYTGDDRFF
jgi:hypothetical protein